MGVGEGLWAGAGVLDRVRLEVGRQSNDDIDLEEDGGFGEEDIRAGLTSRLCLVVTVMKRVLVMVMIW